MRQALPAAGTARAPCGRGVSPLTFRIDRTREATGLVLRLSGRLRAENLGDLNEEMAASWCPPALDLDQVTLVDVEAVRLLESFERRGVELRNCAPYIQAWITRERAERDASRSPE